MVYATFDRYSRRGSSMSQKIEANSQQSPLFMSTSCGNCGKTDLKLSLCSRCHFQKYCGKECQKAHWPEHKLVCQVGAQKEDHNDLGASNEEKLWNSIQQQSNVWQKANTAALSNPISMMVPGGNIAPLLETPFFSQQQKEKVAIDLGCGNGKSTIYLLEKGWKVIAVDKNESCLQRLGKVAQQWIKTEQLSIVHSSVEEYSFSIKPHLVVVNDVFPYCSPAKLRLVWDKIYNSLEEDGYLIGSLFDRDGSSTLTWNTCWFVDNIKFVEEFLDASPYRREICRYRPKSYKPERSNIIEFSVKKASQVKETKN